MSDYTELVKALRCANRYKNFTKDCDSQNPNEPCRYCHHWLCEDDRIFEDAAAAIEALETEIRESMQKCAECGDEQEQKVKELQARLGEAENSVERWKDMYLTKHEPKRGEWELIDGAEPMRWGCSRCKYMSWDASNYCPRCGAKMEVQDVQK